MKGDRVTINNKEYIIKKQLETIDDRLVGFLVADDDWIYGIKQDNKWEEVINRKDSFPKLKMFSKAKNTFVDNPSVDTLEKVYDKLMDLDKYTIVLNLAELKWNSCDRYVSLAIIPSNWSQLVMKSEVHKVILEKTGK